MTALMQRYPDQRSDISANYSTINKLGENGNYYYEVDSNPTTRALECLFFFGPQKFHVFVYKVLYRPRHRCHIQDK